MRRKRSSGNLPEAASRACRLPPRGIGNIDSVRTPAGVIHLRYLVRRYSNEAVLVGLVISLLVALTISAFADYSPQIGISETGALTGARGWDTTNQNRESPTSVLLIENISLDARSGWQVDERGFDSISKIFLNDSTDADGLRVNIANGELFLSRRLCIPVQDYESINASIEVEVLSGSPSLELAVKLLRPNGYFLDNNAKVEIEKGQTETLEAGLSLGELKAEYPGIWFMQAWVYVIVSAGQPTLLAIPRLNVEAHSSGRLCPVTLNLQATDGQTLLSSPYHWEEGYWERNSIYLLVSLSRPSDGMNATIDMWVADETFYLPPANYSVKAAWSGRDAWSDDLDQESAELAVLENQSAVLRMRLPSIMLRIEVSHNMVGGSLAVFADSWPVYDYSFNAETGYSIHLPAWVTQLHISAHQRTPWGHYGYAYSQYEPDGSSDLLVTVSYPYVVLFGVVMSELDIVIGLLIATLLIAVLVVFRHVLVGRTMRSVLLDPWLIPSLMILAGGFLSWFGYGSAYSGGLVRLENIAQHDYLLVVTGVVMPQLGMITQQTPFGLTALYSLELAPFFVPLSVVFFWIPLLGIMAQIGTKESATSFKRVICILCPVALALAFWLAATILGWVPDIGIWMIALSPVVLIIEIGILSVLRIARRIS